MPSPQKQRIILHLDLDAFFAACEERENPSLKGKPVVVGADPKNGKGRGVVSTCSYEARKFGIRSGMPISIAWRKCPSPPCVYLPVNFKLYGAVSDKIMSIARKYADVFEQGGIDECYLDVSKSAKHFDQAAAIARQIKEEIKQNEKLTCSIGIGPNKLIAKIASDFQKPDGLTVVGPAAVSRFLRPLEVRKLRFVGPKTEAALKEREIATIGQLKHAPKFALVEWFGKSHGEYLYRASRGIDDSQLIEHWESKSIGREWTFEKDTADKQLLFKTLEELAKDVHEQFKSEDFKSFKTVTVKVRYKWFETHTHQKSLKEPNDELKAIIENAKELAEPYLKGEKIRLIGVRVSHLEKK
jgi:nucleotidyltransferase/DNA polymerase involved in DNA repair